MIVLMSKGLQGGPFAITNQKGEIIWKLLTNILQNWTN